MSVSNVILFIVFCLLIFVASFVLLIGVRINARQDNLEELKELDDSAKIGIGGFLPAAVILVVGGAVALVCFEKPINLMVLLFGCLTGVTLVVTLASFSALLDAYVVTKINSSLLEKQCDRLRKELDNEDTKH